MHALAGGEADHLLAVFAQQHAFLGDIRMRGGDADHVALGDFGIEAEEQVGRGEMEEVQGMRLQHLAVVHQAAHLLGGGRQRLHPQHHVQRLGGGQVVRDGADAAQALHHDRHFPVGAALDEAFEAAELDDVQPYLMHLVVLVEQQGDLAVAFDARDRLDGDAAEFFRVGGGFQFEAHRGLFSRNASSRGSAAACARR